MEENQRIIFLDNMAEAAIADLFSMLELNNSRLHGFLMENLSKDKSLGIREDVLRYVCEEALDFGTDNKYLFNIATLMCNIKIGLEHFKWVNEYYNHNDSGNKIGIDDFGIVFVEAVEKNIPLPQIKKIFNEESDEIVIYEKVLDYDVSGETSPGMTDYDEEVEAITPDTHEDKKLVTSSVPEKLEINTITTETPSADKGFEDMFNSLVDVMTFKNKKENSSAYEIYEHLNQIIAKFQIASTEMASYSSEVVHEIEKDKEEIGRLNAMITLQQKMINNQMQKINEMRSELVRLQSVIRDAEKTEMRREAINQKISELQHLTSQGNRGIDNVFYEEN